MKLGGLYSPICSYFHLYYCRTVGEQGVNLPKTFVLVACRGEIWGWSSFPAAVLLFHSKNNIDSPIFNLPLYRVGARGGNLEKELPNILLLIFFVLFFHFCEYLFY